jgi:chromate reductase, NAD(P)H dehydrogenase (quinone)
MNIAIISGSLRSGSITKRVALHLYNSLSSQTNHDVVLIDMQEHALPPVQDVWSTVEHVPASVKALGKRIFLADALILVSPEYNGGYSPALKNFLDHFPKQDRKVFGIVTASPGKLGGIRAALQLQQLVLGLSGIGSPHLLMVPEVDKRFAEDGLLIDHSFAKAVEVFTKEFIWLAGAVHAARTHEQQRLVA